MGSAVVDFDHTDAGAAGGARQQRCVKPRRQRGGDAGFQWARRRQAGRGNFRGLNRIFLPVVIRNQDRTIAVAQFQIRIGQRAGHAQCRKAGANAAHDHSIESARLRRLAQEEAGNYHVVTGADKGPGAQVRHLRFRSLIEIVDFDQGNAGGVAVAAHNRGVRSGSERSVNR